MHRYTEMLRYEACGAGTMAIIACQLPPAEYKALDGFLQAAGGRWKRGAGGHVFPPGLDAEVSVAAALDQGLDHDPNPHDFFPTPAMLADQVADMAITEELKWRLREDTSRRALVLEPSAGRGSMIQAARRLLPMAQLDIVAYEIDPVTKKRCGGLARSRGRETSSPLRQSRSRT